MSRAHMIYEDKPLQQEAVRSTKWLGAWDHPSMQKGSGVLLEGIFRKKVTHSIQDSQGKKYRYAVFHVEYKHACQRKYDSQGKEVEPNFGQIGMVRTGYLHSSYKSEMKGTPDVLSFQELCQRLHVPGLTELVQPSHAQTLCFWGEEQAYVHVELQFGQTVRLKTLGDSPFIESLTKLDSDQKQHSANYTGGEKTGRSWTDRVMEVKGKGEGEGSQSSNAEPLPQDKLEGVDDDEWDD